MPISRLTIVTSSFSLFELFHDVAGWIIPASDSKATIEKIQCGFS